MPLATYFSLFYDPSAENHAEVLARAAPAVLYATTWLSPTSVRLDFAPVDIPGASPPSPIALPPVVTGSMRPPPHRKPPQAPQQLIVAFVGGGVLAQITAGPVRDVPTLSGRGAFTAHMSALTSPD